VRRHRAASLAALLVALSLVGGAAVALWQAAEATRARDRAETTAAEAEVVTEFLLAVLGEADADVSAQRLSVAEARAVIDAARERLDAGTLEGQPAARVRLAWTLGRLYLEIGADSVALGLLTDALAGARATHGEVHETTSGVWLRLGHLYNTRADSAAARRAYDAALRAAPADARQARAQALVWSATVLPAGHPQREPRFQRARALAAALPDSTLALVDVLNTFGQKLHDDPARAADLFREALAIADRLGDRGYQIGLLNNLGLSLEYAAPTEALGHLRRARALGVAHLGPRHPEVGTMTTNLGAVLFEQGAHAEAIALLEEAVEIEREARSETSLQVAIALSWLGRARLAAGDARGAADALDEALRLFDAASFDPAHPRIVELRAARAEARRRA
jgi:tetratricopeptide (TPR) repeat protein